MKPNKIQLDKIRMYVRPKYFVDESAEIKVLVSNGYQSNKVITDIHLSNTQVIDYNDIKLGNDTSYKETYGKDLPHTKGDVALILVYYSAVISFLIYFAVFLFNKFYNQ
ncbi:hypothetical protein Phi19:1_gp082 [Cellulophaga phage phi19:1]|uniref:Uncharacterized protein n=1 Tax=Cellulophaga phage phi19:1 TaxID=1327970 RepID=R9ZYF6_9CAUD|nr:hypothetical protein Phi19:1_gp082 [Cellulophaga phage phi19:1]AGO47372.1 hypothetical protein Phi19:1_gp082 [Cellulophaga phage phi19:1]